MSSLPTVAVLGYRGVGAQVDRIEEGFRELGCVLVPAAEADLVYANDATAYRAASVAIFGETGARKAIFNVLDLAPHLGAAFPLARVTAELTNAHSVTCISTAVQRDIAARIGCTAPIVYNPIRAVARERLTTNPPCRGLFVGRVNDPEKRAGLGAAALSILGYGWDDMVTVGREPPHYGGCYAGEVDDAQLSRYYNAADFLICPTRNAFLGLPILEAMACGTIPVVCNDLDVRAEFLPPALFPEYDEVEPNPPSLARFIARFAQNEDARAKFSDRLYAHYITRWAGRLSPRGVAQAILEVYRTL